MVKRLIIALQLSRITILVGGGGKTFSGVRVSLRHSGQTVNKMSAARQRADGRSYASRRTKSSNLRLVLSRERDVAIGRPLLSQRRLLLKSKH